MATRLGLGGYPVSARLAQLSFALTDPVETAAFSLTEADRFHFALTDVVETAHFSGVRVQVIGGHKFIADVGGMMST